jgi:DNA/RNA endonuclease G (NUC1)
VVPEVLEEGAGGVDGDHIAMGNPSGATTNIANENNYLMEKAQFKLSYNRSKATLTASWHLDPTWMELQHRMISEPTPLCLRVGIR